MSAIDVICGDSLHLMPTLAAESFDSIVTDPPYGLEFMGKEWDSFRGEAWRSGAGMSKPGIGDRPTAWPSFGGGDSANATCASCGGRMRGKKRCRCEHPDWRVKGRPLEQRNARAESMQSFGVWCEAWAAEALRVAKPGAHLLAFGGTRTYHRLACAIEDAGWEIRDCIMWIYGSGFPKSLDVSKAIDKAAGAEREVVGYDASRARPNKKGYAKVTASVGERGGNAGHKDNGATITAPATDAARHWQGWGTALKPAYEPIIVARKPLAGTVADNVLRYGTGGLNIDGCRVAFAGDADEQESKAKNQHAAFGSGAMTNQVYGKFTKDREDYNPPGRWPANLIHDGSDEVVGLFPVTTPAKASHRGAGKGATGCYGVYGGESTLRGHDDSGGSAARFFYTAKASRSDRGEGNNHPTVKPTSLMEYLIKLVTPPGGHVLDPFGGSGTTAVAAKRLGFRCTVIELQDEYCEIIRRRLSREPKLLFSEAELDSLFSVGEAV